MFMYIEILNQLNYSSHNSLAAHKHLSNDQNVLTGAEKLLSSLMAKATTLLYGCTFFFSCQFGPHPLVSTFCSFPNFLNSLQKHTCCFKHSIFYLEFKIYMFIGRQKRKLLFLVSIRLLWSNVSFVGNLFSSVPLLESSAPVRIYADEKKVCVLRPPILPSPHILTPSSNHLRP